MLILEFGDLTFYCDDDEYSTVNGENYCTYTSGEDVLSALGVSSDDFGFDFFALMVIYVFFLCVTYAWLSYRKERVC